MLTTNQETMSVGYPMLSELKDKYGFDQWMILRIHGADCVVLETLGSDYDIAKGMVFKLNQTIQSNMSSSSKATVVLNIESESDALPFVHSHFPIQSYLHLPIIHKEHKFLGLLCAISTKPQLPYIANQIDEINKANEIICKWLDQALEASKAFEKESRSKVANDIDPCTKLYNWRGWERLLDSEETRCQAFGYLGDIVTIDITGITEHTNVHGGESSEILLRQVASILKVNVSESSFIAHIDGSEFVLCTIDNDIESIQEYADTIAQALKDESIAALVGYARSIPNKGLRDAWEHAEHMLYKLKSHALIG